MRMFSFFFMALITTHPEAVARRCSVKKMSRADPGYEPRGLPPPKTEHLKV